MLSGNTAVTLGEGGSHICETYFIFEILWRRLNNGFIFQWGLLSIGSFGKLIIPASNAAHCGV